MWVFLSRPHENNLKNNWLNTNVYPKNAQFQLGPTWENCLSENVPSASEEATDWSTSCTQDLLGLHIESHIISESEWGPNAMFLMLIHYTIVFFSLFFSTRSLMCARVSVPAGQGVPSASWWCWTLPVPSVKYPGSIVCTWPKLHSVSPKHTHAHPMLPSYWSQILQVFEMQ